jgi:hypothetical protein
MEAKQDSFPQVGHYKDRILNDLASSTNVAQFVSFSPTLDVRHCQIGSEVPDKSQSSPRQLIERLLHGAAESRVNIRSFRPEDPKSKEFVYALSALDDVIDNINRLSADGLYTIVNETINVDDGGVSGVLYGGILEFAPGDTPRCVERSGTASLPADMGMRLLETVYGFPIDLNYGFGSRVEFSLHPTRRGVRNEHVVIWEIEQTETLELEARLDWPNRFSRLIGDKLFGLLIADALGYPVPYTIALPRRVAPFRFGQSTGSGNIWTRTCPATQVPGKYTTCKGWTDPFILLSKEDPENDVLASVLSQEEVNPVYSGSTLEDDDRQLIIEGVSGPGDRFMKAEVGPECLPEEVVSEVRRLHQTLRDDLGSLRFEWVFDGARVWILQLHRGAASAGGRTIFPGEASTYRRFDASAGLDSLRSLVEELNAEGKGEGIMVVGKVGVTSHLGDILRRAQIPSYLEADASALTVD